VNSPTGAQGCRNLGVFSGALTLGIIGTVALLAICCTITIDILKWITGIIE
jgi:hypothetical protein